MASATSTSAGYRNLDAIRAIRKSSSFTNLATDAKLVTYGYSGGAFGGELASP
jgi:hypothetical protein